MHTKSCLCTVQVCIHAQVKQMCVVGVRSPSQFIAYYSRMHSPVYKVEPQFLFVL